MKRYYPFFILLVFVFTALSISSCGNNDKGSKPDPEVQQVHGDSDDVSRPADITPSGQDGSGTTGIIPPKPSKDDILANIDQYLVSTANIPTPVTTGGIQNASVTIKNTMTDVTIQKAIVEVSILTTEGAEFRTDYYVLQNVEPGETEIIKIPRAARGNSIVSHIVKLKSQELTNGEMILVGHRVTAK